LLLVSGNAVQDTMNGGDHSVIGTGPLAMQHSGASALKIREGKPQISIHDGHVNRDVTNRERGMDSRQPSRRLGCAAVTYVQFAFWKIMGKSACGARTG
jgi:hypothetical protein